jgi:hypothetical protein
MQDSAYNRMLARFRRVMPQLVRIGATVDIGPPEPGVIRFLTHSWGSRPQSPFFRDIDAYDRTWKELILLRKTYESPLMCIVYPPALEEYETTLRKEMCMRFIVRKWIGNLRRRVMMKKGINEDDLYTTGLIPEGARVRVCDYASRRFYDFHVTTIVRIFTSALFFNNWGVPDPQMPKNPYTNLTWNVGQLVSITQQIVACLNRYNRIIPSHLAQFRLGRYDVDRFFDDNVLALRIHAAQDYLKNLSDPDVMDSYIETINDLYDSSYEAYTNQATMRRLVVTRKLPVNLLRRWDKLVIDNWIYLNHAHLMHPWKVFEDMIEEFNELHTLSTQWWSTQPRHIIRRPVPIVNELPAPLTPARRSVFVFGFDGPRDVPENAIIVRMPARPSPASDMDVENDSEE